MRAALLSALASLPPERAALTRRLFAAAMADLDDGPPRSAEADAAAAAAAAAAVAVLATLRPVPS